MEAIDLVDFGLAYGDEDDDDEDEEQEEAEDEEQDEEDEDEDEEEDSGASRSRRSAEARAVAALINAVSIASRRSAALAHQGHERDERVEILGGGAESVKPETLQLEAVTVEATKVQAVAKLEVDKSEAVKSEVDKSEAVAEARAAVLALGRCGGLGGGAGGVFTSALRRLKRETRPVSLRHTHTHAQISSF